MHCGVVPSASVLQLKKYCFNHDALTQRNRIVQTHVIPNQWEPMDVVELVGGAFAHGSVVSAWLQLCAWTEWMLAEKTMGWVVKFRDLSKPSMFMLHLSCVMFSETCNVQHATAWCMLFQGFDQPKTGKRFESKESWQSIEPFQLEINYQARIVGCLMFFGRLGMFLVQILVPFNFFRSVDIPYHVMSCHITSPFYRILSSQYFHYIN